MIFRYFKKRKVVKKVNKALGIKLHKWQIAFIFDGKPYSEEIMNERCNGKTLAHILRICLKLSNADIQHLQREGKNYRKDFYLYITKQNVEELRPFADRDSRLTLKRMHCFLYNLRDVYERLVSEKTMKGKLRDIRFRTIQEGERLI